ncbi:MAG: hypothetical protein M3N43_12020 [Actinomycetota bacterium]|nr:hypothetical protein [Actinomycetota bacterium]
MQLTLLGLALVWIWAAAVWVRGRIALNPGARKLWIVASVTAIPAGALIALWLPEQIPFNRESPGGIFYVYLPCFAIGGGLCLGGIGGFIGALLARPGESRE